MLGCESDPSGLNFPWARPVDNGTDEDGKEGETKEQGPKIEKKEAQLIR